MVDAPSDSSSQLSVGASSLPCGAPATVESISNMSSPIGGIGKRLADMDVDRVCQELPRMAPAEHKQLVACAYSSGSAESTMSPE